jgi:hypothetical protein
MNIKERVNAPKEFLIEVCKELGYDEYRTDKINLVKDTPVGRIHITLVQDRSNSTKIEIHHDIIGIHRNQYPLKQFDGTPRKAWDAIQGRIYDKRMEKKEEKIKTFSMLGGDLQPNILVQDGDEWQ